jgi:hypothetical protein
MPSQNSLSTLTLRPMTRENAALFVKRLLGSYPSLSLHDPETYIAELIVVLLQYSPWVGEKAIDAAKKASPVFVPTVPAVANACEAVIGDTRRTVTWAQDWNHRTQLQLEERERIEAERERPSQEVLDRVRREMAVAGMPILGDKVHAHADTPQAVCERFNITDEQWAAIPDAPRDFEHWRGIRAPKAAE